MADSSNKVIGLRKLDIIPSSHTFSIALKAWSERPTVPDEEEDWSDWETLQNTTTVQKPLFFHEGSYTTPPHYINDNPGFHSDDEFEVKTIEKVGTSEIIGYTCKAIKAKLYQYNYTYGMRQDGRYQTNIQRRSTNDTVTAEWVQSLYQCFSVTEDNILIEIVHLMTQEFCAFTSWYSSKLHYIYDYKTGSNQFKLIFNEN